MPNFGQLLTGYRTFKATEYEEKRDMITHLLRQGAKPTSFVIAPSSLRISPDVLFGCNPGDLFVARNIGGFVPAKTDSNASSVVGAIDYAVEVLGVENIVILANAKCEGVRALMKKEEREDSYSDAFKSWLKIAEPAWEAVKKQLADRTEEEKELACEQEVAIQSLKNLLTYDSVKKGIKAGNLSIYSWHFNIESGLLTGFNPKTKSFEPIL